LGHLKVQIPNYGSHSYVYLLPLYFFAIPSNGWGVIAGRLEISWKDLRLENYFIFSRFEIRLRLPLISSMECFYVAFIQAKRMEYSE
jgi:hypothetical protein